MLRLGNMPNLFGDHGENHEVNIDTPFNGYKESKSGLNNIFDF